MNFDKYTLHARVYPTVLCIIPIVLFVLAIDDPTLAKLLSDVVAVQVVGQIGVGVAAFFLLMQLARSIGKDVFERFIFDDELEFPTTTYLMPTSSELSVALRTRIAAKTSELFDLELPTIAECEADLLSARRQARDIVAQIRGAAGKPELLQQRNWEYGFYRNLIGGSVVAFVVSIVAAYGHAGTTVGYVCVVLSIIYLVILLSSPWLLRRSANHYARQLFSAFLGDQR